jgi:pyruvate/2-oxoglutarate dehydrogenase complex dihydrolipoamide acyltransferase (E2) component
MMQSAENPRAVAGDNNPPDPLLVEAEERIGTANRYLTERGDPGAWTAEIADKANFFIGQCGATWTALDNRRKDENRAWLAKQDAIYRDPLTLLVSAKDKLTALRRTYLKREEDRLAEEKRKTDAAAEAARKAAEEAERKAAEAATVKGGDPLRAELEARKAKEAAEEAAEAAAAAPVKAAISGTYSTRSTGLKDHWRAEITDLSAAFRHYNKKGHHAKASLEAAIRDAIFDYANAEAKRMKTEDAANFPPGIKFIKERK